MYIIYIRIYIYLRRLRHAAAIPAQNRQVNICIHMYLSMPRDLLTHIYIYVSMYIMYIRINIYLRRLRHAAAIPAQNRQVNICIHMYLSMPRDLHTHMYICIHVYNIYMYQYISTPPPARLCCSGSKSRGEYICLYIYLYGCLYIYVYIYICI